MTYFLRFPTLTYMGNKIQDISFRVALQERLIENTSAYEPYRIKDGEKIEDIAYKLYGNSEYHWIIMLANQLVDPFYDWPLVAEELNDYVSGKYGVGNEDDPYNYENDKGRVVLVSSPGAVAVSNREHEDRINETRREIKLFKPEYVSVVLKEFDLIINKIT